MKKLLLLAFFLIGFKFAILNGQSKKIMDHTVFDTWKTIDDVAISNNGEWVHYNIKPHKGDQTLHLYNSRNQKSYSFNRAENAILDSDNRYICFLIKTPHDTLQKLKRNKIDKEDFPNDTLGFYDFEMQKLIKIPNVESYKMPKDKGGLLAYKLSPFSESGDSLKKESEDNGSRLVIRNMKLRKEDTISFVKDYLWSKNGAHLAAYSTGKDTSEITDLIIYQSLQHKIKTIWQDKAEVKHMGFDEKGNHLSFLMDSDTTESINRPMQLMLWTYPNQEAKTLADFSADFLHDNWNISEHKAPSFSKNASYLYFGIAPRIIEQDTNLLEDEIVNVEVWSYKDQLLYTEQKVKLEDDKKKNYLIAYDLKNRQFRQCANENYPDTKTSEEESQFVLLSNYRKYRRSFSWEGISYKDAAIFDIENNTRITVANKEEGNFRLSPLAKYVYWYSRPDSSWKSFKTDKKKLKVIADKNVSAFYNEMNDRPMLANAYGVAGWTTDDKNLIIYDRYDLWLIDPNAKKDAIRLTKGRENKISYRYIKLDPEESNIKVDSKILLRFHNEENMSSGYAHLDLRTKELIEVISGDHRFGSTIYKAKNSDDLIYTKESFKVFPDLIHSDQNFENNTRVSDANPQQEDYYWGSAELVNWKDERGIDHKGMLYKPEGFDKEKNYPLMVNFYEKSSDRLHRHRAPFAHRSTINYTFYLNRGYVIFNPDVHYDNGYPGESCYKSVMSGIDHILKGGFIDESRIGVQGHSWGGYQVAHLITKTDRFKCAESGAPVVNMFSAYGGIRWRSGLSRMFQYEHTQSRIGATIWERPDLYKENSPLFNLDKVNTPVLIMHNDKDGAVPWYQGIEFFVAMRRLDKPAWLLNYNDEPHWPVKRQNRLDFNKRMQQFFDHYLLDEKMPSWMRNGVPAIEKGINQGFELDK